MHSSPIRWSGDNEAYLRTLVHDRIKSTCGDNESVVGVYCRDMTGMPQICDYLIPLFSQALSRPHDFRLFVIKNQRRAQPLQPVLFALLAVFPRFFRVFGLEYFYLLKHSSVQNGVIF